MPKKPERFTECSRVVLSAAHQTANRMHHKTISLEHFLVGLVQESGVAGEIFRGLGLSPYEVLAWFRDSYIDPPTRPNTRLSDPAKRFLESAVDETRRLWHRRITTGHLLLAFLRQRHDIVNRTLAYLGLNEQQIRVLINDAILANKNPRDRAHPSPKAPTYPYTPERESTRSKLMQMIGIKPVKVSDSPEPLTTSELINHVTTLMNEVISNPHLYTYCASLYLKAKNNVAAKQDYVEAIRLYPKFWMAYFLRGELRFRSHEYDAAIADFSEVIRLEPGSYIGYSRRGSAYVAKQDGEQAVADYDQALKLEPADQRALIWRGGVFLNNREFERAIADYDAILRQRPKYTTAQHNRGTARAYVKDYDGADFDYREVIRKYPNKSSVHSNIGWLSLLRQEYDKAIEYCNEAIRLDPQNGPAYYSRGTARAALGDSVGASADYRLSLANWKNMNTKLAAPYAEEMQAYLDQTDKPEKAT